VLRVIDEKDQTIADLQARIIEEQGKINRLSNDMNRRGSRRISIDMNRV
jgi:hypothetical protein